MESLNYLGQRLQVDKLYWIIKALYKFNIKGITKEAGNTYIIVSARFEYTDSRSDDGPASKYQRWPLRTYSVNWRLEMFDDLTLALRYVSV